MTLFMSVVSDLESPSAANGCELSDRRDKIKPFAAFSGPMAHFGKRKDLLVVEFSKTGIVD